MYYKYTQEELRTFCRQNIEAVEMWGRRLVQEKMVENYGENYIEKCLPNGESLVKKEIREHVSNMRKKEPERFPRPVDALFIDQLIYFLCKKDWYEKYFKKALDYVYPQGNTEAFEFLNRLVPIRNAVSHANPISVRQAEQAICYSQDFVEGLKKYYKARGEEKMFNVPQIIRVSDSLGNVFYVGDKEKNSLGVTFNVPQNLQCGDKYSVEVEVDSSFRKEEYTIKWSMLKTDCSQFYNSNKFVISLEPKNVSQKAFLFCTATQNKEWHKFGDHDSKIALGLTVLPPVE